MISQHANNSVFCRKKKALKQDGRPWPKFWGGTLWVRRVIYEPPNARKFSATNFSCTTLEFMCKETNSARSLHSNLLKGIQNSCEYFSDEFSYLDGAVVYVGCRVDQLEIGIILHIDCTTHIVRSLHHLNSQIGSSHHV